MFWNTVLIYVVDLPCSSDKALDCWDLVPTDRAKASAVGAIPVKTAGQREAVLAIAKTRQLMPQDLKAVCGAKWRGNPTSDQFARFYRGGTDPVRPGSPLWRCLCDGRSNGGQLSVIKRLIKETIPDADRFDRNLTETTCRA